MNNKQQEQLFQIRPTFFFC